MSEHATKVEHKDGVDVFFDEFGLIDGYGYVVGIPMESKQIPQFLKDLANPGHA